MTALGVNTPVGPTGTIRATGIITSNYSDGRLKTNVTEIDNALQKVLSMTGIMWQPNNLAKQFGFDTDEKYVGLIAQQVQTVMPEVVSPAPFDISENGGSKSGHHFQTIYYERLVPLLIQSIKEQQVQVKKYLEILEQRGMLDD